MITNDGECETEISRMPKCTSNKRKKTYLTSKQITTYEDEGYQMFCILHITLWCRNIDIKQENRNKNQYAWKYKNKTNFMDRKENKEILNEL